MAMDLPNIFRAVVVLLGGIVVGGGTVVLIERARFYRAENISRAPRAMYALALVNVLVLTYIGVGLAARWDEELSWRTPIALVIFGLKGLFFRDLRATGLEQERRALYASPRLAD